MIRCKTKEIETSEEIIILRTMMSSKAQAILQRDGDAEGSSEFLLTEHIDHIREMIEWERAEIEKQAHHIYQIHPHTRITHGPGSPSLVDMVSRIAKVEKRWLRKNKLYWNAIICAPSERQAAEAKLENRAVGSSNSANNKSSNSSVAQRPQNLSANEHQISKQTSSLQSQAEIKTGPRPRSLPSSTPSFHFKAPGHFEEYQALATRVPDIQRQMMHMKDSVAANLLVWNHFATSKPNAIIEGIDPNAEARKKLALWAEYADYVGITDMNLQRAKDALENGKVVYLVEDGAHWIVE